MPSHKEHLDGALVFFIPENSSFPVLLILGVRLIQNAGLMVLLLNLSYRQSV